MTAFDRLKELCDSQGISVNKLEENLDLSKNTLYSWKKNIPKGSNLIKVADYFKVSTDYLLGRTDEKETSQPYYALTDKDERDIAKDLERMMEELESGSSMAFMGEPMSDEDRELLRISLENTLRMSKEMAKKKFTPKKFRK
ncbi:helix-turn-helix transcriptional regulator [Paenibacillus woosongensis]|uniref:Helix-turn-helix transcriptional regulator n=1 Tax=Paenibacillus woosongensis TaxID=307580 RepID=A0AA95I6A2_9BACL|nr:helix-turn-helix transcriptional regulator [Paenibacillus woosongensis]WHX50520.1 helix-turn-helix transcriptional regulator [Paenibacillus woosongensis]